MTILLRNTKDKPNKSSKTAYFLPSTVKREEEAGKRKGIERQKPD